jgi:hypothetical protein
LDRYGARTTLTIRELGGAFEAVWPNFFGDCGAWVFVLDASDAASLAEGAVAFLSVAGHPEVARARTSRCVPCSLRRSA